MSKNYILTILYLIIIVLLSNKLTSSLNLAKTLSMQTPQSVSPELSNLGNFQTTGGKVEGDNNLSTITKKPGTKSTTLDDKVATNSTENNKSSSSCNITNIHQLYPSPETPLMRYNTIAFIIILGFLYLTTRLLSIVHNNYSDSFCKEGVTLLEQNLFSLFICFAIAYCFYSFGLFDNVKINWDYVFFGLFGFIVFWSAFCLIIIYASYFLSVSEWRKFEEMSTSFEQEGESPYLFFR